MIHVLHVAHDHHRDLKCQRIIKFPDIQTGALLQLLQPIYERIPVNIQLTRGLRYVQIVLKEFADRRQCLLIK